MNYNETLNYIHSLGFFSHTATLDRIKAVMEKLCNPQNDFRAIHIAGTNGKGSVCMFVSSALAAAGYKVGTFVSPFITDFCERIQINGEHISRDDLCRLSKKVIDTNIQLTEFEFITAVGFLWFSEQKIDIAVVETGLGGRLDATNVLPQPLVSVITKIGLDHTAVLGDTLEKITAEKCGIIKGDKVITTHNQPTEALGVIKDYAAIITPNQNRLKEQNISILGNSFNYKGVDYKTTLGGQYQIENALLAIETLKNCGLDIADEYIKSGLENAFIPARLEAVRHTPLIVIDGAHNPDGAEALCEALKEYSNVTAIIGVMKDKNYKSVLQKTLLHCKNVICIKPAGARALPAHELADVAKLYCNNVFIAEGMQGALNLAKQNCGENSIFIFGSLYLASEIRPFLTDK